MLNFKKITPVNGFDASDPNNAMQNNYAWSMAELEDYIYVGTGRNILYMVMQGIGLHKMPNYLIPDPIDMNAEIWRYKKDETEEWQRVYKAQDDLTIFGFRFMIQYTTPQGETALYAGANTFKDQLTLLKSTDGLNWTPIVTNIQGTSTRAMSLHNGKLYMGVLNHIIGGQALLYESSDPAREGWNLINFSGDPDKNPRGGIDSLASVNNKLYVGTSLPGGLEVWRTTGCEPTTNEWELVLDKGAGDALNEVPFSLGVFRNNLYVGTGIALAFSSVELEKKYVPPKGADLIRVHRCDKWKVIIGREPVAPTKPTTGERNRGRYTSGLGNISNAYFWQLLEHNDKFYLGTFSWSSFLFPKILIYLCKVYSVDKVVPGINNPSLLQFETNDYNWEPWLKSLMKSICKKPFNRGFDLYVSNDAKKWNPISLDGLGNPNNYGVRTLLSSSNGNLYLGTANPFEGCEIWVSEDNST